MTPKHKVGDKVYVACFNSTNNFHTEAGEEFVDLKSIHVHLVPMKIEWFNPIAGTYSIKDNLGNSHSSIPEKYIYGEEWIDKSFKEWRHGPKHRFPINLQFFKE